MNLLAGKAEVQYNPDVTGPRHIIRSVQEAGFEAQLLSSNRCVWHAVAPSPLMRMHCFLSQDRRCPADLGTTATLPSLRLLSSG